LDTNGNNICDKDETTTPTATVTSTSTTSATAATQTPTPTPTPTLIVTKLPAELALTKSDLASGWITISLGSGSDIWGGDISSSYGGEFYIRDSYSLNFAYIIFKNSTVSEAQQRFDTVSKSVSKSYLALPCNNPVSNPYEIGDEGIIYTCNMGSHPGQPYITNMLEILFRKSNIVALLVFGKNDTLTPSDIGEVTGYAKKIENNIISALTYVSSPTSTTSIPTSTPTAVPTQCIIVSNGLLCNVPTTAAAPTSTSTTASTSTCTGRSYLVAATATQNGTNSVSITYQGGTDSACVTSMTCHVVPARGTGMTEWTLPAISSPAVGTVAGCTACASTYKNDTVVCTATFADGSTQVILDAQI
jgi:hypothetical protein